MGNYTRKEKLAAIGAIELLPMTVIPTLEKGRLKGMLEKLQKADAKALSVFWPISKKEFGEIAEHVDSFSAKIGWQGKEIPTHMWVEFAMLLAEKYKLSDAVIEILISIYEYFERDGNTENNHSRNAAFALRVWEGMIEC